jgi:hypothetical protein
VKWQELNIHALEAEMKSKQKRKIQLVLNLEPTIGKQK